MSKHFMEKRKKLMKPVRTMSGVTPVAVLTKPFWCPGQCIFCPNDPTMPKSYLASEPGAQRADSNRFDPYLQVFNRLIAYRNIGHPTDKIELIILGGSWSVYPRDYQLWFVQRCFDAMNDFDPEIAPVEGRISEGAESFEGLSLNPNQSLEKAQQLNETAKARCIGLVVETRPDLINENEIINIRELGATKVQMGIQSLDDKVLQLNKRGHDVLAVINVFKLLRLAGFKIHAHWMPNLYGSTPEKDIKDFSKIFANPAFKPDELKIYPCSLIAGTELVNFYEKGLWYPYSDEELLKVLVEVFKFTPRYCRLTRVIRDIPSSDIVAGNKKSNFRQIVEKYLHENGIKAQEIRSREIKNKKVDIADLTLKITEYDTLVSKEMFLEFVTPDDEIAAFLRLSFPFAQDTKNNFIKELQGCAMIREIHVYGQSLNIGLHDENKAQHSGLGKRLIAEAKKLSKENEFKKLAVISSVGTREYYRKNDFEDGELYQIATLA